MNKELTQEVEDVFGAMSRTLSRFLNKNPSQFTENDLAILQKAQ